jgi:hypothetical protein
MEWIDIQPRHKLKTLRVGAICNSRFSWHSCQPTRHTFCYAHTTAEKLQWSLLLRWTAHSLPLHLIISVRGRQASSCFTLVDWCKVHQIWRMFNHLHLSGCHLVCDYGAEVWTGPLSQWNYQSPASVSLGSSWISPGHPRCSCLLQGSPWALGWYRLGHWT